MKAEIKVPHHEVIKAVGKDTYASGKVSYWYQLLNGAKMTYSSKEKFRYQLRNQAQVVRADKLVDQLDKEAPDLVSRVVSRVLAGETLDLEQATEWTSEIERLAKSKLPILPGKWSKTTSKWDSKSNSWEAVLASGCKFHLLVFTDRIYKLNGRLRDPSKTKWIVFIELSFLLPNGRVENTLPLLKKTIVGEDQREKEAKTRADIKTYLNSRFGIQAPL